MARFGKIGKLSRLVLLCGLLLAGRAAYGQETRLPNAEQVKTLQARYQKERDGILKDGIDRRFLPVLVQKADEMAKKAQVALEAGRLLQASELFRQARWQLPYQSKNVPDQHVSRILGNLRLRHGHEIYALAFSPDGKLLATGSRDRTVKIWDLENGHELLTYTGHGEPVRALAFSPDGKLVASGGPEKDIRLWEPRTGKDVRTLKGEGTYVTGLVFSKDGKHLVAGQSGSSTPGAVTVYEVDSGAVKRSITDFRSLVYSVAFNHDGTILGVGVGDGTMKMWEYPRMIENPAQPEFWAHQDPNGATYQFLFSPDNRTMTRISSDGIKLYNMVTPGAPFGVTTPRKHIFALADNRYTCAVFSKDSKTLFTGATDGIIRVFDADTGEQTATFKGHNAEIRALTFNPGGTQLASASSDYTVRLWDFDIVLQSRDHTGHDGPVWTAYFSPDGQTLVTASADRTARVIDAGSGEVIHTLTGHKSPVTYAIFSPDGKRIATASGDKLIKIWDAVSGKHLKDLEGHAGTITSIDFAPDNVRLVSGSADKTVRVWNVDTGKAETVIEDNRSVVASVAFSPRGNQIAVGNVDQTIKLHDASTGKLQHAWNAHAIAVTGVAYSPNGTLLASCGADNLVRVWKLAKPGESPLILPGHTGPLSSVAFRNDNQHLVSCGADMTVKLWKLEGSTFKDAQTYRGHRDWVSNVSFSKDGYFVVSAGVDKLVKVWEITSREIPFLTEHTGSVDAVAVSPDGKLIATGATDRSIKVWDREKGAELFTLRGHTDGVLALVFLSDNKTLVSSGGRFDRNIKMWDVSTGKEIALSPGQQHAFTGLIAPCPYLVAPIGGGRLHAWVPPDERYSIFLGWDPATGNELFNFQDKRNIAAATFSANGKFVAAAARDGSVRIFDLEKKGEAIGEDWSPLDKDVSVGDIALTPDGKTLAVSSEKGEVKILDVATRKVKNTIQAHRGRVIACLVTPDGKRLATVGNDNMVKLWNLEDGAELRAWDMGGAGQGSFLHSLAFSPDSRHLITGNANTTVFVLDLP